MMLEVGQYAAHCCGLALKTLYAIHNPDVTNYVFKNTIRHDLTKAWSMLEGEQGYLIAIMRTMPLFIQGDIDEAAVRTVLTETANFDELRWFELSDCRKEVLPYAHLQLAWAAYLRCRELMDNPTKPRRRRSKTKISLNVPSSLQQRPSPLQSILEDVGLREHLRHFDVDRTSPTDWARLATTIRGLDKYDLESLIKTRYGLLHSASGAYVFGSTFQILVAWALARVSAHPNVDPITTTCETGLGNVALLTNSLLGRLEVITGNYAYISGILEVQTIDGRPLVPRFVDQLGLHTHAAVFACELTLKWLYALTHPDIPLRQYKATHDVKDWWNRLSDNHDKILDVFHAMPLFQADGPIEERETVTTDRVSEMLGWFSSAYVDARYGITDPSRDEVGIVTDYRINLHLAWSVYLFGYQNIVMGMSPAPPNDA